MYGYIYKITNLINNKIYVGKHKAPEFTQDYLGSGVVIKRVIKKYGKENFKIEVLDTAESIAELNLKEQYWIAALNARDRNIGYNVAAGGDGGDTFLNLSPEAKELRRKHHSEGSKGKKLSEETKRKISLANKGKYWVSPEGKERSRQKHLGMKPSQETIEKRRIKQLVWTKTHKKEIKLRNKKISTAKKGKVIVTEEQKQQISATLKEYFKTHKPGNTGKQLSDETKKHLSEVHSGRIQITNGIIDKVIKPEELQIYLDAGWYRGRTSKFNGKKIICLETNELFDSMEDLATKLQVSTYIIRTYIKKKKPINGYTYEFYLK